MSPIVGPAPRVLVAPDKFKGTLSAVEAAASIASGVRAASPDARVRELPIADGGEGSVAALVAAGAALRETRVHGPLRREVSAQWAALGETAIIELAEASGLQHALDAAPADAFRADTRGVGQLIRAALDEGFRSFLIAVGGSATTDGGFGAIVELGLRVTDADGGAIADVDDLHAAAALDDADLDPRLRESRLIIATDVTSPLTGPRGAARMFGPQKGADEETVRRLERRLEVWGALFEDRTAVPVAQVPGAGAAGGFAAPFVALGIGGIRSGADEIAALIGFDAAVADSDIVVVGEGSLDAQSLQGKGPIALARRAADAGAFVVALCGRSTLTEDELAASGISRIDTLLDRAASPAEAFDDAARVLALAAEHVFADLPLVLEAPKCP